MSESRSVLSGIKKAGHPGVFFKDHPTRKHGVKFDRLWIVRQTLGGVQRVSVLGWTSERITFGDATNKATAYKSNYKWNEANPDQLPRPICKANEDEEAARLKEQLDRERKLAEKENMTILQLWDDVYYPSSQQTKKERTVISEKALFDKWIRKQLGKRRIADLLPLDFTRMAKAVMDAGRSPRTVHYVASILLQMWSLAFDNKLVVVQPPRRKTLNLPDIDNERTRAFTVDEAQRFLAELKERSQQWHDISKLSLLAGLRASEVFKLKLQDIDLERGTLFLRTPKKNKSQHLQISDAAQQHITEMLSRRDEAVCRVTASAYIQENNITTRKEIHEIRESAALKPVKIDLLVFTERGEQIKEVSDTIDRAINTLGLNDGADKKNRLTFHSLRHTAATWMLEQGEDIYRVSKMLRHTTVKMTEQRYAHLSGDTMKRTADSIGVMLKQKPGKVTKLKRHNDSD